jgi:hypothetical protein
MQLTARQCETDLLWKGRTLYDSAHDAVFFNWTCAGFTLHFRGTRLEIEALAFAEQYPGEGENLPWFAVFLNGEAAVYKKFSLTAGESTVVLFESETPEEHTLQLIKLSEGSKGRSGLRALRVEGELLAPPPEPKQRKIEFIGDSITCGFGNEMSPEMTQFSSELENGMLSYAGVCADLLGAKYQSICASGIPLCWALDERYRIVLPWLPEFETSARTMEGYYPYADRYHEEAEGKKSDFTPWDFSRFVPDAVVINLGTNDAFRIRVSGNDPAEAAHFQARYVAFLERIRGLNGKEAWIVCTLGSMDYFLYDVIEKAADQYRAKSGDERVYCLKFGAIDPWGEGLGGQGHPNTKSHARMGKELAALLETLI